MANHNEMNGTVDNKRSIIKEEIILKIHVFMLSRPLRLYIMLKIKSK